MRKTPMTVGELIEQLEALCRQHPAARDMHVLTGNMTKREHRAIMTDDDAEIVFSGGSVGGLCYVRTTGTFTDDPEVYRCWVELQADESIDTEGLRGPLVPLCVASDGRIVDPPPGSDS